MRNERYPAWCTDYETTTKKRKKKLTKRIGIMVQNGSEIGIVESAQCDRLQRPTLGGGIVNVDRRWVGSVRIENVDSNYAPEESAERFEHTNLPKRK
jgi:hypothetical protein